MRQPDRANGTLAQYGPWALITGGSQGIGLALADALAARGLNIVIVALPGPALQQAQAHIESSHGVEVLGVGLDLSATDALGQVETAIGGRDIGLLVCAAAHVPVGPLLEQDPAALSRTIDVNCRAPLALCHHFGHAMAARGRGGIILISSMSSLQGSARVVTYAATKAFEVVLAEGMWEELREQGVDVLAVLPGLTDTPGLAASHPNLGRLGRASLTRPAQVAEEALEALGQRSSITVGRLNRGAAILMGKILPRAWAVRLVGRNMRQMYDRDS